MEASNTAQVKRKKNTRLTAVGLPAEIIIWIILGLFCILCVIPFVFVAIISFSAESSIREVGFTFFPNACSLEAY